MRTIFLIALAVSIVSPGVAYARPLCLLKGGTQREINECSEKKYREVDSKLNADYAIVAACLKPSAEQTKRLVQAQRAWLHFRDSECLLENGGDDEGGTSQPAMIDDCKTKLTSKRVQDLQVLVQCVKMDLGADCPKIDCKLLESDE